MQQPPFRADHVGSFLRPKFLLDAREQFRNQEISSEQLREVEDRAIRDIVKFQEDLGLEGITDGEYRRTYFHTDFLTQFGGVVTEGGINVSFKTADGSINFAPPVMKVEGKVSHLRSIQGADFDFLKSITNKTPTKQSAKKPIQRWRTFIQMLRRLIRRSCVPSLSEGRVMCNWMTRI